MAITLRNKRVEDDIRAVGRETGEGPSAVIARLAAAERRRVAPGLDEAEAEARFQRACAFLDQFPPSTDQEKFAMQGAADEMYDWGGLPR